MSINKKILLTAGGTGGHFFPAIALSEELSDKNIDIHLVTDLRCKKYLSKDITSSTHIVDIHIKTKGLLNKIKSVFNIVIACCLAFKLLWKLKPNLVIGFGGYPTFPILLASKLLRIPIILQEQNCFLGKTSKYFAKYSQLISTAYKDTKNIESYKDKIIFTGDVVRKNIREMPSKKTFNNIPMSIFIFGGSQGAEIFSKIIPETLKQIELCNSDIKLNITHQVPCNKVIFKSTNNIKYNHSEFFHNISAIYQESDLVIARSGAGTIAELSSIGLPAIFVPYPYASDNHQYLNAKSLKDCNASWIIEQKDINADLLAAKILELYTNRTFILNASEQLLKRKKNGAKNLADTVLKIITR